MFRFLSITFCLAASSSFADTATLPVRAIGQYMPGTSPASTGLWGSAVGIGVRPISFDDASDEATRLLQMSFTKGTSWPVDFAVLYGFVPESFVASYGGHVQWGVVEVPKWPSVALRVARNRVVGLPQTQYERTTVAAPIAYGYGAFLIYWQPSHVLENGYTVDTIEVDQFGILTSRPDVRKLDLKKTSNSRLIGFQVDPKATGG